MNSKITEHYARGEEKFIAEFNELNDAKFFMTKKSAIDEIIFQAINYKQVGNRPARKEPRRVKRRPKSFPSLQKA